MGNSKIDIEKQYDKLAQDWRDINNIIWGIPAVAISIMTGIIVASYQAGLMGWPRIILLGVGSILLFALSLEVVKKRLLMNAISKRLHELETKCGDDNLVPSPYSTPDLLKYTYEKDNPDDKDPVYVLFKWSYARQYLTQVVFVAAILVTALTEWEFYNYLKDLKVDVGLSLLVGFLPIAIIAGIITWVKIKKWVVITWYAKGNSAFDLKKYEDAIKCYNRAIQIDPNYVDAVNKLLSCCDKALEIDPNGADIWCKKGTVLLTNLGKYEEAVAQFDKALGIKPGYADAWYNRACSKVKKGDIDNGLSDLKKAIEIDKGFAELAKEDKAFEAIRNDEHFKALIIR
jgi:tetratricopeptide (TPR) repeat protein